MDETIITPQMMTLAYAMIAAGLIMPIVLLAAMVRCGKNAHLSKAQKGLWQFAHVLLMFPAFIYLIVVDRSPWWKAAGAISLVITVGLTLYIIQNISTLPAMPGF